MAPRNDSLYRNAADVAESLFAMLIAGAEIAVVDVDREMLPKQSREPGRHETVKLFAYFLHNKIW